MKMDRRAFLAGAMVAGAEAPSDQVTLVTPKDSPLLQMLKDSQNNPEEAHWDEEPLVEYDARLDGPIDYVQIWSSPPDKDQL